MLLTGLALVPRGRLSSDHFLPAPAAVSVAAQADPDD
jgi:hypothetical protein